MPAPQERLYVSPYDKDPHLAGELSGAPQTESEFDPADHLTGMGRYHMGSNHIGGFGHTETG